MSELCAIYYEPVLHFVRRWSGPGSDATDLTHGFFAELLRRESPGAADPGRGRFRNYLFAAVRNHLCKQRARESAEKRGGGISHVAFDESEPNLAIEDDHTFDRAWALALIRRSHQELQSEMEASGRGRQFAVLQPWLDGGSPGDAVAVAAELDLSPTALKVAIHRLRERFRQKVRNNLSSTIDDPTGIEDEFRHLVEVLVRTSD
jgi:RNA polymerase sigma-70 factor (ECF subfamily)